MAAHTVTSTTQLFCDSAHQLDHGQLGDGALRYKAISDATSAVSGPYNSVFISNALRASISASTPDVRCSSAGISEFCANRRRARASSKAPREIYASNWSPVRNLHLFELGRCKSTETKSLHPVLMSMKFLGLDKASQSYFVQMSGNSSL